MGYFGTRSALVAGAMALAVAAGAAGIFATERPGAAYAQDDEREYEGIVETLPPTGTVGSWRVSGRTIFVTDTTEIDTDGQTLAPGLRVEIEGVEQSDGSIIAREIEVDDDDDDGGPSGDDDDENNGGTPSAGDDDDDDTGGVPSPDDDGDSPDGQHDDDDDDGAFVQPLLPVGPEVPGLPDLPFAGGDDDDDDDGSPGDADDDDDDDDGGAPPAPAGAPPVPGLPGNPFAGGDDDD